VSLLANRLESEDPDLETKVREIVHRVRTEGAEAVSDLTELLDGHRPQDFRVSPKGYIYELTEEVREAIALATSRVRRFQEVCRPGGCELIDGDDRLAVLFRPLSSVGIYVPGGSAPLLSSLIMTAVPAQVAGVERIAVASPPPIADSVMAVAEHLGLEEVYCIGGAQAVASLAYGVPDFGLKPVDKIVGPGNRFVTEAKRQLFGKVGIDSLYGPSELAIIADSEASSQAVALDLMSQLEHGSGWEATCLLTDSRDLAVAVEETFWQLLPSQPNRNLIEAAWQRFALIGVVDKLETAVELIDELAPEHLELKVRDPALFLPLIRNAGAIFTGRCNEALGDYLAGPSHCLPTGRTARFASGLGVWDFLKRTSLVDIQASDDLRQATAILARLEGMHAHARAASAFG
jgi:histidinol dehydrogenase